MPPILQRFETTQADCKSILFYGVLHVGQQPITELLGIGHRTILAWVSMVCSTRVDCWPPQDGAQIPLE